MADSFPARSRQVAPPHPGEVISGALDDARITRRQAAAAIGLSPTGLNKVLNAQGPVTASTALRLAAYLGGSPDLWLRLQAEYDLWHERERLAAELAAIRPASEQAQAA